MIKEESKYLMNLLQKGKFQDAMNYIYYSEPLENRLKQTAIQELHLVLSQVVKKKRVEQAELDDAVDALVKLDSPEGFYS